MPLLPVPLPFGLVDILEVFVGEAALVDGVAVGDRRHLLLVQQGAKDPGAGD